MALLNIERSARQCAFAACSHRRRLWKNWLDTVHGYWFESRWYCSPDCFRQALTSAIGQLLSARPQPLATTHRAPLGLLMLSRGFVDQEQLKEALKAQKESGTGRVGEWLRHLGAATEEQVTQALGLQWSIPVFPLGQSRRFLECAHLVPFPLLQVAEMLPVHHLPTSQHLYVAFVDRINHSALYAVERVLDCHTEPCFAVQSHIVSALQELKVRCNNLELAVDNISSPGEIAGSILAHVADVNATNVRVSGFDGYVWTRIISPKRSTDLVFQTQKNLAELIGAAGME